MNARIILLGMGLSLVTCFAGCSWLKNFIEKSPISVEELSIKADQMLLQLEKQGEFGGAVLLAKNNKIVLCKGYGKTGKEALVPITPDTRFCIGSITKSFTAMLVLLLAQDGKLKLNDPIQKYLKDFKHPNVTIFHLLTHTSGLPREAMDSLDDKSIFYSDWGIKHILATKEFSKKSQEAAYTVPLNAQPGTKFAYSNIDYLFLTSIINQLDGSYATSLEKRILKPLGMQNTTACLQAYDKKNSVASMAKKPSLLMDFSGRYDVGLVDGAGSIISSVRDIYRFSQCIKNNELLSKEFAKIHKTAPGPTEEGNNGMGYACGIIVEDTNKMQTIWHNGGHYSYSSMMSIRTYSKTKDEFTVVILSNQGIIEIADGVASKIYDLIEQKDVILHENTSVISQAVAKQYEGVYRSQAKQGQPSVAVIIKAKQDDTLWAKFSGMDVRLQQEKDAVFGSNIVFGGFTYTFVRKNDKVVGFKALFSGSNEVVEHNKIKGLTDYISPENRVAIKVDPKIYDQYVGQYKLKEEDVVFTVTKENNSLFLRPTGKPKFQFYPESENEFFCKIIDVRISFVKDEKGKIVKLIWHQGGADDVAQKIE